MGQCFGIKYTSFLSKRENVVQWAFKLKSALPTTEILDLEDQMLMVDLEIWDTNTVTSVKLYLAFLDV